MVTKRVILVLMAASLLLGCQTGSWAARASGKPIVIGAIFSTTGDNAPLGVPERDTVKMLEKEINEDGGIDGRPIKVEFYDDGGKPDQAVQACQELLANKDVVAIIGPTLTGPSLAIAEMCEKAKMPLVSCAASIKIVKPVRRYVFKTAQSDALAVAKLLTYCKRHKIKTVGFINDSNAFGASGREQWLELSKKAGVQTLALESFATNDTDMTSQLTKIRSENPDAVVCWGTNPGPAIVAKAMRRLGMKQPLLMSHGIANKEFIKLAGSASEGVVFPGGKLLVARSLSSGDPQKNKLLRYAADYSRKYNRAPNT
jgi:branched-chain amino acid transport system substrate-binding protein